MQGETEQYRRIHVVQLSQSEDSATSRVANCAKKSSFTSLKKFHHMINRNQVDAAPSPKEKPEPSLQVQSLARMEMNSNEVRPASPDEVIDIPITVENHSTTPIPEIAQISTVMTSALPSPKKHDPPSTWKRKECLKGILFGAVLASMILALIITPIAVVHSLPTEATKTADPCASRRTLTFDDIDANPTWNGTRGFGMIPQGYGSFIWSLAVYVNASQNAAYRPSLTSGSFVASIDDTNPSNKLKITHTTGAAFHVCSMVVASISTQTPFTLWGFRSNHIVYIVNVTINPTSSAMINLSTQKLAVDAVEMFGYGTAFSFDNLVIGE